MTCLCHTRLLCRGCNDNASPAQPLSEQEADCSMAGQVSRASPLGKVLSQTRVWQAQLRCSVVLWLRSARAGNQAVLRPGPRRARSALLARFFQHACLPGARHATATLRRNTAALPGFGPCPTQPLAWLPGCWTHHHHRPATAQRASHTYTPGPHAPSTPVSPAPAGTNMHMHVVPSLPQGPSYSTLSASPSTGKVSVTHTHTHTPALTHCAVMPRIHHQARLPPC